jgi:hypothetical protein
MLEIFLDDPAVGPVVTKYLSCRRGRPGSVFVRAPAARRYDECGIVKPTGVGVIRVVGQVREDDSRGHRTPPDFCLTLLRSHVEPIILPRPPKRRKERAGWFFQSLVSFL